MENSTCHSCGCAAPGNSAFCPECGTRFSGGVLDFGIGKCLHIESHSFWFRGKKNSIRDSAYSNSVVKSAKESLCRINKGKGRILLLWLIGLFGTLGFHCFAVGRILAGSMRLLWAAIWWTLIVLIGFFSPWDEQTAGILRVFFAALAVLPVIDLAKITLGQFRDVFKKKIR